MNADLVALQQSLAARATEYDRLRAWPTESLNHLTTAGAWKWIIPRRYGGLELPPLEHLECYEAIAMGCMATLLILANRDGACELIAASDNEALKSELLPQLATGRVMTSVGISQLTTSHQSGPAALSAQPDGDGFRLNGFMPWVTSAVRCQFIVTGALFPDGMQLLALVHTDAAGVTVDAPLELMTLQGTLTSMVQCRNVFVDRAYVLRGPAPKVLATRSGVKPSLVAASGIGLARAMLDAMKPNPASDPSSWDSLFRQLSQQLELVRRRVYDFAGSKDALTAEGEKTRIRIAVNDVLMRLSVALLSHAKGSGLLQSHDAQRLVREAMFFLVWAAPEDVRAGTLEQFLK